MGYGDDMESGKGMGFGDCKGPMMALDSEMGWDLDTWSNCNRPRFDLEMEFRYPLHLLLRK